MSSRGRKKVLAKSDLECPSCNNVLTSAERICRHCKNPNPHFASPKQLERGKGSKRKIIIITAAVLLVVLGVVIGLVVYNMNKDDIVVTENTRAIIHTTEGDITLRFFPNEAPKAVKNFVGLAKKNYYNDVVFHRVINGFMIQGGDPTGTGFGGESYYGKGFGIEPNEKRRHYRGAISTAKTELPNSIGSQFFIVQTKPEQFNEYQFYNDPAMPFPEEVKNEYRKRGGSPYLDGRYTVFGEVVEGMDVVDKIAAAPVDGETPINPVKITGVTVID